MKPLWNCPSLGTVHPSGARFTTAFLVLFSGFAWLPLLILSPYAVIISAAWSKRPAKPWRIAAVLSVGLAVALAIAGSPLVVPAGMPIALPADDPWLGPVDAAVTFAVVTVNAGLAAGFGLLPLAAASTLATVFARR